MRFVRKDGDIFGYESITVNLRVTFRPIALLLMVDLVKVKIRDGVAII